MSRDGEDDDNDDDAEPEELSPEAVALLHVVVNDPDATARGVTPSKIAWARKQLERNKRKVN